MTDYSIGHGGSVARQHLAWIGAAGLAYIDVFGVLTLSSLVAIPLALLLRKVTLGVAVGH